ncbi:MAG: hypothetical protein U9Q58_02555 [Pseudomonadota bacterium]|nr:hypothetical protein [Pseudomonadota bacterium]
MPQLHCYVPDEVAAQFQQKAKHAHLSVSKYLAKLIKNEIAGQWPEGYFDLFGSWEGDPLERPEQGLYEKREELK